MPAPVGTGRGAQWPDELAELVRSLWQSGMSAGEILKRLPRGHDRTRNAIIGFIHRMKWEGGSRPPPGPKRSNGGIRFVRKRGNQQGGMAFKIARGALGKKPVSKAPIAEPPTPTTCEPVTLMDVQSHHCRFVIGETAGPLTMFCGSRRVVGRSFCGFHARLAYQPPQPRRTRHLEHLAGAV